MIIRILLLALIAMAIVGCHTDVTTSDDSGFDPMRDITDRTICSGATPPSISLDSTAWHYRMRDDDQTITIDKTYDFVNPNQLTVTKTCTTADGASVYTTVSVPIQITGYQIQILQSGQNDNTVMDGLNQIDCPLTVHADTYDYGFVGACLELNDGNDLVLIP
jgi:hypothetical protein